MILPAAVFLAFGIAAAAGPFDGVERITPEQAVQRAAECGLGPVKVRYEELFQSDVLTLASVGSATDDQLACLDRAVGWGNMVELPDGVQTRFDALRNARAGAILGEHARTWLAGRGLLDRVPSYVAGTTDEATFTRAVETLCGSHARGAFQSEFGPHVLSPDWLKRIGLPPSSEDEEGFDCVTNVAFLAGFDIGFVGNAALAEAE